MFIRHQLMRRLKQLQTLFIKLHKMCFSAHCIIKAMNQFLLRRGTTKGSLTSMLSRKLHAKDFKNRLKANIKFILCNQSNANLIFSKNHYLIRGQSILRIVFRHLKAIHSCVYLIQQHNCQPFNQQKEILQLQRYLCQNCRRLKLIRELNSLKTFLIRCFILSRKMWNLT